MSNPWFRLYSEAVDDEKLRLLAFEDRWHYIALLCCKNNGILDDQSPLMRRKVAVKLGLDLRELDEVARRLSEVGLIDQETFQPLAWDKRQYKSDKDSTAAERQKRFRESRKSNALRNGDSNGDVTRPDTDTDTDTDTEEDKGDRNTGVLLFPNPEKKKKSTPVPKDFEVTEEMFDWAVAQGVPELRIRPETEQFLDRNKAQGSTYLDWNAAWRTWMRNSVKFARTM